MATSLELVQKALHLSLEVDQDYWVTPEGLVARAEMVAQNFVWGTFNEGVQLYALAQPEPPSLEWITSGLPTVCDLCTELEGVYDPATMPEWPAHFGCNCSWQPAVWQ